MDEANENQEQNDNIDDGTQLVVNVALANVFASPHSEDVVAELVQGMMVESSAKT